MTDEHIDPIDYVMDAQDEVSRRRADQHLKHCAQCRAEVAEWREATSVLAESPAHVDPPAALRDSILAAASTTPQDSIDAEIEPTRDDTPEPTTGPKQPPRLRARWLLAAAAAVVLLVAGGVTVAVHPWSQSQTVSAVAKVTSAPDAQRASKPVDGGSLEMVFSTAQEKAVATLRGVAPAADGKVYQAWLITPSGMVDAGLLQPGKPTVLNGSIAHAKGAAVTVEPAGGSTQPTSKPIVSIFMS